MQRGCALLLVAASACAPREAPRAPPDPGASAHVDGELLVRLAPGLDARDAERVAMDAGAYALRPAVLDGWWRLSVDPRGDEVELAARVALASGVAIAAPNARRVADRTPNDRRFPEQYAHRVTHAERGWDVEIGDPSVVVAVIGSGVAMAHQDLAPNIFVNGREIPGDGLDNDLNGFIDDLRGWDFAGGDPDPSPVLPPNPSVEDRADAAHETAAAGVVGAVGSNDIGVTGVAWDVSLMPLRFDYTAAGSAEAITYAARNGAAVITMSYGSAISGEDARDPIEEEAVELAARAGVVLVASAGNESTDLFHFPAAFERVIAVAATDRDDRRADFSNYGYWVDVTAPGVDMITTFIGGGYNTVSGTSFSCPYAAGVAALLVAAHPTWSAADVRRTLLYTGEKLYADEYVGTRVDVGRALARTTPARAFARFIEPFSAVRHPAGSPLPLSGIVDGERFEVDIQPLGGTWRTFGAGTMPVDNGLIATLDTRGVAPGEYRIRLTAIAGTERDVDWLSVTIAQGTLPGWPVAVDAEASGPVVVGDVTGDGRPEVIAPLVRAGGALLAAYGPSGALLPGWPVELDAPITSTPLLGDVDADGVADVVAAAGDALLVLPGTGGQRAPWITFATAPAAVALGNLVGDDRLEIAVADREGRLWALDAFAQVLPGWPIEVEAGLAAMVVADLDGDGYAEIATVGERLLHVHDGGRRDRLGTPVFVDGVEAATLMAADLDGDGQAELFVGRDSTVTSQGSSRSARRYHGFRLDGERLPGWPTELERAPEEAAATPPLAAADVDGDGRLEVLIASASGVYHAIRADGREAPGWPSDGPARPRGTLTAGDVDGDGRANVLGVSTLGVLGALDSRGRDTPGFPLELGERATTPPVLTDLDDDGRVDVVVAGGAGVYAFRAEQPYRPEGADWPLPRRDGAGSGLVPAPFPLKVEATTPTALRLTWNDAPGPLPAVTWWVERDDRVVTRGTARTYDEPLLGPREAHTYRVIGFDVAGNVVSRSRDTRVTAEEIWCTERDGAGCDDGDACSANDTCAAGRCGGLQPAADGTRCDDGDACTLQDRCAAGVCTSTSVRTCAASGTGCIAELCDPASGACVPRTASDGAPCEDGNACTGNDTCAHGVCLGGETATDESPCNEGQLCARVGVCRAGRCEGAFPLADGTPCASADTCEGRGTCVDGTCTGRVPDSDGTPCEDGDACTLGDACQGGHCGRGALLGCAIEGQCLGLARCDPRTGACFASDLPDFAPCDDGQACTQWDVCVEGQCTGRAPLECNPGDACDPETGLCASPPTVLEPASCGCAAGGRGVDSLVLLALASAAAIRGRGRRRSR